MKKYTYFYRVIFNVDGQVKVEADNEDEAKNLLKKNLRLSRSSEDLPVSPSEFDFLRADHWNEEVTVDHLLARETNKTETK